MPRLIKDSQIVEDDWQLLLDEGSVPPWPSGKLILPLAAWLENQSECESRSDIGVWIDGDAEIHEISASIVAMPLIAVRFPTFMDGRGFSTGRLLRERYLFEGELRAIGHFMRDQLCYLRRCGYSSFQFADDVDLDAARESLEDFQEYYQTAVDQSLPLFRRRHP